MTDRDAILATIRDHPEEDTPRLAYADWLDDHAGDLPNPVAARDQATFIRLHVTLLRTPHDEWVERTQGTGKCAACQLYAKGERLWRLHSDEWEKPIAPQDGLPTPTFRRGFVAVIPYPADKWITDGDSILAAHPVIEEVQLSTAIYPHVQLRGRNQHGVWAKVGDRPKRYHKEAPAPDHPVLAYWSAEWPLVKKWRLHLPGAIR